LTLQLLVNTLRFGAPWQSGYVGEGFSTPLFAGVYGLLFSTGRGLLVYSPLLIAVPMVLGRFFRYRPLLALVIVETFVLKLLLFGQWWSWQGGWSWGSRFLLPAVPLLFLSLNELFLTIRRRPGVIRALVAGLIALGLFVQLVGVLSNPNRFGNDLFTIVRGEENQFLFIPQLSFFAGSYQLIRNGIVNHFSFQFADYYGWGVFAAVVGPLAAILVVSTAGLIRAADVRPIGALSRVPKLLRDRSARPAIALLGVVIPVLFGSWLIVDAGRIPRRILDATGNAATGARLVHDRAVFLDRRVTRPAPRPDDPPQTHRWEGWLRVPISGDYTLHIKSTGWYEVRIGAQTVAANRSETRQYVATQALTLDRGLHSIRIDYMPADPAYRLFQIYWTIPGFGIQHGLLDNRTILAEPPSTVMRILLAIDRFKVMILALTLISAHALAARPARLHRNRNRGSER
jgi:hypothetical protein